MMELGIKARVNHIGVVTRDHKKTAAFYEALGYKEVVGGYDPYQNVYGYFYEADGFPTIELLMPYDDKSPINKILDKNGVTPYHICYEIEEPLEDAIKSLKKEHFLQIAKPTLSTSLGNRRVCFLYHKDVGIIELLEK